MHRATGSSKPPPGSLLSWRVPGTLAWTSIASSSLPCAGTQGSIGCHRTHRALFVWPKTTSNTDTQRQQETFSSSVLAELASLDQTLFLRVYRANKHERHRFTIHSVNHNGRRNIPNAPVGPSEGAELEPFGATCSPTVYMTPNSDSAELDMAISSLSVPPASFSTFHPWSE